MRSKAPEESSLRAISTIRAQEEAKSLFEPVVVRVIEREIMAFSTPEYERSWLMRSLASLVPNAERALFECSLELPDDRWDAVLSTRTVQPHTQLGFCGLKYFSLYGPDRAAIERVVALAASRLRSLSAQSRSIPREFPGSIVGLGGIECVKKPSHAEYCTLKYTTSISHEHTIARLTELWLKAADIHYTLNTIDNKRDFAVAPDSRRKKSAQDIHIYTSLSEVSLKMRLGCKTNLQKLSEAFSSALPSDDTVFIIESWD